MKATPTTAIKGGIVMLRNEASNRNKKRRCIQSRCRVFDQQQANTNRSKKNIIYLLKAIILDMPLNYLNL